MPEELIAQQVATAVAQIREGDGNGVATLFDLLSPQLRAFHRRYRRLLSEYADDVEFALARVADVYQGILEARRRGEAILQPLRWVRVTAKNRCIDALRRARRHDDVDELANVLSHDALSGDYTWTMDVLRDLFDELGPEERIAFGMARLLGWTNADIARRRLEAATLPAEAWRTTLDQVADSPEFRLTRGVLRLADADAVYFALPEAEWRGLLASHGLTEAPDDQIAELRKSIGNRLRHGRFRAHHWVARFLPEEA
jgi:DNA-directed RNA polymerase specialized sigma24 family protein